MSANQIMPPTLIDYLFLKTFVCSRHHHTLVLPLLHSPFLLILPWFFASTYFFIRSLLLFTLGLPSLVTPTSPPFSSSQLPNQQGSCRTLPLWTPEFSKTRCLKKSAHFLSTECLKRIKNPKHCVQRTFSGFKAELQRRLTHWDYWHSWLGAVVWEAPGSCSVALMVLWSLQAKLAENNIRFRGWL